jgi:hypothetical protein
MLIISALRSLEKLLQLSLSQVKWNLISYSHLDRQLIGPGISRDTEVEPSSADGTASVTVWESRSLPEAFFVRLLLSLLTLVSRGLPY